MKQELNLFLKKNRKDPLDHRMELRHILHRRHLQGDKFQSPTPLRRLNQDQLTQTVTYLEIFHNPFPAGDLPLPRLGCNRGDSWKTFINTYQSSEPRDTF